jgi:iron complex transport system ATP-binding protein
MKTLLEVDRLSFHYPGREVLHEISLALEPGKFYGLLGSNGSGKTTLLDLMIGNLRPTNGGVFLHGKPLPSYPRRKLAREMALIPQEFRAGFDFSVFEIVLMGRHPYIPRFGAPDEDDLTIVQEAMEAIGVAELADRPVTALSGGEKQRVIAARALAQNTPLLIMDEATANLDVLHTRQIFNVVKKRVKKESMTVIAAIHNLNQAAAFCDEIFLLKGGKIFARGLAEDILVPEKIFDVFGVRCRTGWNEFSGSHQVSLQWKMS